MADHGDWGGNDNIFSKKDWRSGSEYGGVEGLVPPLDSGHTNYLTAGEQLMLIYDTKPVVMELGLAKQPTDDFIPETDRIAP